MEQFFGGGAGRGVAESTTDRRDELSGLCDRISGADSKNDLISAIDDALRVGAPEGDPGTLESLGKKYKNQADDADRLQDRVFKVARRVPQDAMVGHTGNLAGDAVAATARAAGEASEALAGGGKALIAFSDAVEAAQKKDSGGRSKLRDARGQLGGEDGWFDTWHEDDGEENAKNVAKALASTGVGEMHEAASDFDAAARKAARELNKWAAEARSGKLDGKGLTAVDKIMLADASNVSGDAEMNEILTANDLERSGRAMNNLSAAERARMDQLLANADSPQEKAYLMKALASGSSVVEVEEFAGKIHGKDPYWLESHLSPISTAADSRVDEGRDADGSNTNEDKQTFYGQIWRQGGDGSEGTCVASSTVTARAMVDPVYALELTGGPNGDEDDPDKFRERLVDEQHRVHEDGDGGDDWEGMGQDGKSEVIDQEISPHTGSPYEKRDLDSPSDRREVLPEIEAAVAEGKPVPIGVEGEGPDGREGHALMIVGQEGDMLQVYNPWGTTTWVSEDDFVSGNMSGASADPLSDAYAVNVPKG